MVDDYLQPLQDLFVMVDYLPKLNIEEQDTKHVKKHPDACKLILLLFKSSVAKIILIKEKYKKTFYIYQHNADIRLEIAVELNGITGESEGSN